MADRQSPAPPAPQSPVQIDDVCAYMDADPFQDQVMSRSYAAQSFIYLLVRSGNSFVS